MRGETNKQEELFSYVSLESRIAQHHPLRLLKQLADEVLREMSDVFDTMYSEVGRPSIAPETLLKSQLLAALYSVRSDRMFCERLRWDLLFCWFLDMNIDEAGFDATVFTKNRQRLLEHEVAREFLDRIVGLARRNNLLSDEHFTVDGTLIESWASLKSFKPKDKPDADGSDFRGQKRSNVTHRSTTDPEARLYRKGPGREAKLSYSMNLLADNRHGLIVDACLEQADGWAERQAALELLDRQREERGVQARSAGADKAYHCSSFVAELRARGIKPHIACRSDRRVPGLDRRTTRQESYMISQRKRKLIEQPFGWMKVVAGIRRSRFIGLARTELSGLLAAAAYNLLRIAKLLSPPVLAPT